MTSSTVLSSSTSSDSLLKVESNGYVRNNWYQSGHPTRSHSVQSMIGALEDLIVTETDEWHFTRQRADEVYSGHNELIHGLQKLESNLRQQHIAAKKRRKIRILLDSMKVTRARIGLIGLKLQNREKNGVDLNIMESELQHLIELIRDEEMAAEIVEKEPDVELDESDSIADVHKLFLEKPECKPQAAGCSGNEPETFGVLVWDNHDMFDEMSVKNTNYVDVYELKYDILSDICKLFDGYCECEDGSVGDNNHNVLLENLESVAMLLNNELDVSYVLDKGKDISKVVWMLSNKSLRLKLIECNDSRRTEKQVKQTHEGLISCVFDRGKDKIIIGGMCFKRSVVHGYMNNMDKRESIVWGQSVEMLVDMFTSSIGDNLAREFKPTSYVDEYVYRIEELKSFILQSGYYFIMEEVRQLLALLSLEHVILMARRQEVLLVALNKHRIFVKANEIMMKSIKVWKLRSDVTKCGIVDDIDEEIDGQGLSLKGKMNEDIRLMMVMVDWKFENTENGADIEWSRSIRKTMAGTLIFTPSILVNAHPFPGNGLFVGHMDFLTVLDNFVLDRGRKLVAYKMLEYKDKLQYGRSTSSDRFYCQVLLIFFGKFSGETEQCNLLVKNGTDLNDIPEETVNFIEFLWSSDEINFRAYKYWPLVMDIARRNKLPRIMRCCQIMGRLEQDELSSAQIFYPRMQCSDILKAYICQLGVDQHKVNVLAREYCDDIKRKNKPRCVMRVSNDKFFYQCLLIPVGQHLDTMQLLDILVKDDMDLKSTQHDKAESLHSCLLAAFVGLLSCLTGRFIRKVLSYI